MKILNIKSIIFLALLEVIYCCNYTQKEFSFFARKAYENLKNGKPADAYEDATKAIKSDPKKPIGYILRGKSLLQLDSAKSAKKDFARALRLDSDNTTSLYFLGLISYDENDYPLAINYFNKAIN